MSEDTQGASSLPEGASTLLHSVSTPPHGASTLPHGASTLPHGASTLPHGASTLQSASTPPRDASTPQGAGPLLHGASTPQSSSTLPPSVASSPIVAQLASTRSPSLLTAKTSKRERLDNFFKGKSRAAYRLSPELDGSLSSSETSLTGVQRCQRGCTEVLGQLVDIFHSIGRHNAKTEATYSKSYTKEGDHTNVSGEWIEKVLSSVHVLCFVCVSEGLQTVNVCDDGTHNRHHHGVNCGCHHVEMLVWHHTAFNMKHIVLRVEIMILNYY